MPAKRTLKSRKKKSNFKPSSIKPKDTVHVNSTQGHKLVVKKDSPYHKQAKKTGKVISTLRPAYGNASSKDDPRSVENYREPTLKRTVTKKK